MQDLKKLIDRAAKVCGNDRALAERMGIYIADVSHLRKGKRPFSPELAAELAAIASEDPVQAAVDAIVTRAVGTRKETVMDEIFSKKDPVISFGNWESCFLGRSISSVKNSNKRLGLTYLYEQRMQFVTECIA